ncbi:hypothetical protein [Paenibacillus abyssi]|uniref:Uncharacterized protein n=1 Tax=Paenibacillus abyssi TaxID=1340531 RepID=A0A917D2I4_9BACL|nr:hypothetical protein [Paenibacillus abyssi]GGG07834.1 hypothetical protein GCM10010916_25900 [Paenibacillus abyssi]
MVKYPVRITDRDELHSNRAIRHVENELMVKRNRVYRIHTAWELEQGTIMVHEYVSCNQPSSSICFFDTLDEYMEACQDISWIQTAPIEVTM